MTEEQESIITKAGHFWVSYDEVTDKYVIAEKSIPILFNLEARLTASYGLNSQILTNPMFSAPGLDRSDIELAEEIYSFFCREDALKKGLIFGGKELIPDEHYLFEVSDKTTKKKIDSLGVAQVQSRNGNPVYYIPGEIISGLISKLVDAASNVLSIREYMAIRHTIKNGDNHKYLGGGN